jgi:Flp pilus assembly protein TadG
MVELALVVTLVLTLLFGLISYGMIFAVKQTVSEAAAEGARAAVPASDFATATSVAAVQAGKSAGWLGGSCNSGHLTCTASPPYLCNASIPNVYCVRMTVAYDWSAGAILPALPFVPQPTTIQSVSVVSITAKS